MTAVMRNVRVPVSLDAELEENQPKLNIRDRYLFFISLGLRLFLHRTYLKKHPEIIEKIVNQEKENLVKMNVVVMTNEFFKKIDNHELDSLKYLIESEKEDRIKKEVEQYICTNSL